MIIHEVIGPLEKISLKAALIVTIILLGGAAPAEQRASAPFNNAEVTAGHTIYVNYCSQCHLETLLGQGDAPPLTGGLFRQDWSKYTIRQLYQFVSNAMPQGLEGDLKPEEYSDVIAFLLAANGAQPDGTRFDPGSNVVIGSIANGMLVPAIVNAPISEAEPNR